MSYSIVFSRKNRQRFVVATAANMQRADRDAMTANQLACERRDAQLGDVFLAVPSNLVAHLPLVPCLTYLAADALFGRG